MSMFDRCEDVLHRYQEVVDELGDPGVTADPAHFRDLMKEQTDLTPLVEAYTSYKKSKASIAEFLEMLETESSILPPVGGIMPSAQYAIGRKPNSESCYVHLQGLYLRLQFHFAMRTNTLLENMRYAHFQ